MNVMRTRTRLAALALISLGALSGCGGLQPGAAVIAGDSSISNAEVDSLSRDLCTALKSDEALIGEGYPRSRLLQSVVQSFLMRSIADQMAEQYDVTATDAYVKVVEQTRQQFSAVDPAVLDRMIDSWVATNYFVDVLGVIGDKQLTEEGVVAPDSSAAVAKGIELAQVWEKENGVTISPRFPTLTLGDTEFTQTLDNTAFPVSDFAKEASADEPSAEWVASLPASQRCD